jgi:hypothetical protein
MHQVNCIYLDAFNFSLLHSFMFDFLSKFGFGRSSESKKQAALASNAAQVEGVAQVKQEQKQEQKQERIQQEQEAQAQMQAVLLDETRLIQFLSSCTFPELRLQGAQHVKSKEGMELLKKTFLKSDKRVVKLMQQGLQALLQQQQQEAQAHACFVQAQKLLASELLLASQVADLDKQKNACVIFSEDLVTQFNSVRQQLELRLQAQVHLQRLSLDQLKQVQLALQNEALVTEQEVDAWQTQFEARLQAPEASSLPRHLTQELTLALSNLKKKVQQTIQQTSPTKKNLESVLAPNFAPISNSTSASILESEIDEHAAQEKSRETTEASSSNTEKATVEGDLQSAAKSSIHYDVKQLDQQLSQLEAALENGQIVSVKHLERQLRAIEIKHWPERLRDRAQVALQEFARMQSWAKWSGQVSREQLVQTAEELASLSLAPKEIQNTVSALRQQWKEMEHSASGGVGRELWLRFDAACTKAYAPAAQFFQEQAQLRHENANKAQLFLDHLAQQIPSLMAEPIAWRSLQQSTHQIEKEWRSIGVIERKLKSGLDNQFDVLLNTLQQALNEQRQLERQQRQHLIAQAQKIEAGARNGVEQVKSLQEQWQQGSTSSILRQQDEQKLWKEFRAACDAVFEQRKEFGKQEQEQRLQHLAAKQALCLELENALNSPLPQLKQLKNEVTQAWKTIGWVPKNEEAEIEARYQDALQKIDHAIADFSTQQLQLATQEFFAKYQLCLALENKVSAASDADLQHYKTQAQESWQAIPTSSSRTAITSLLHVVQQRFDKAVSLSSNKQADFAQAVQANQSQFASIILQLEIACSCETPAEFEQQRLQAQIQMLKDSLQQGKASLIDSLSSFLSLPVALNEQEQQRSIAVLQQAFKSL